MGKINKKTIIFLHDYEFCLFPSIFYNKCEKKNPKKLINIFIYYLCAGGICFLYYINNNNVK